MDKCTGVRCPMQYGYKVEECNHTDCPYRTEPITNADRIRAMSDEELAELLNRVKEPCDYCDLASVPGACTESLCDSAMQRWLKQPAE